MFQVWIRGLWALALELELLLVVLLQARGVLPSKTTPGCWDCYISLLAPAVTTAAILLMLVVPRLLLALLERGGAKRQRQLW